MPKWTHPAVILSKVQKCFLIWNSKFDNTSKIDAKMLQLVISLVGLDIRPKDQIKDCNFGHLRPIATLKTRFVGCKPVFNILDSVRLGIS